MSVSSSEFPIVIIKNNIMQFEISAQDIEILNLCPICQNDELDRISEVYLANQDKPFFTTDICLNCSTVVRLNRPSPQWYDKAWEKRNTQSLFDDNYSIHSIYNKYLELCRYIRYSNLAELFSQLTKANSLIDIGTGPGTGLRAFSERSWKAVGLEPDPTRANLHKNKFNFKIEQQTVEEFIKNNKNIEQFDIATVIHTLEHCHNPLKFLKDVLKIIKENGYLYIEVPNAINFINWKDSLYLEHLINFNQKSLIHLTGYLKLKPIYIIYPKTKPNGLLHIGILYQKMKHSKESTNFIKDNKFIENIKNLYINKIINTNQNAKLKYIVPKIDNLRNTYSQFSIGNISNEGSNFTIKLDKNNQVNNRTRKLKGIMNDYINYLILDTYSKYKIKTIFRLRNKPYDENFFKFQYKKYTE